MKKLFVALRALGIVLGIWLILALVAWIGGVFPGLDRGAGSAADGADAGATEDASGATEQASGAGDAGDAVDGATGSTPTAIADLGDAGADAAATPDQTAAVSPNDPSERPALRVRVCTGDAPPMLVAADVLASGEQELVFGCGDRFSLLTVERGEPHPRVRRVARFSLAESQTGAHVEARSAAAGDVDMDGRVDLAFGFVWMRDNGGGPQGGALDWVGRDPGRGFVQGQRLAPIAASRVELAELNGRPGAEILALNTTDAHGRRPSELWVFAGGAAPTRIAKLDVGRGALDFALLDLDADQHADLAALSQEDPKLRLFFGDGAGAFEGPSELSLGSARGLTQDLRADGGRALVADGATWARVAPGVREELAPEPIAFADAERAATVTGLTLAESDGDLGLLGLAGHDLVALGAGAPAELLVLRRFPPRFLPLAFVVAPLDGERGVDLAALVRGDEPDAPLELILVSDFLGDAPGAASRSGAIIALDESREPLLDSPLTLEVTLP